MFATELRKRTVFLLASTSIITLVLLVLPTIVDWFLTNYGMKLDAVGGIAPMNEQQPMSQMTQTASMIIINILHLLKVGLGMAIVVIVVRYINYLIFQFALRNSGQTEIASLFRTILSIIVCIVAFFIIFQSQYPGVQLAPLFTGSTILGIVVGLALQDTLGNLFAGIALQADQPFQIGDVINIQNNRWTGVVESVSWRGVKIRTFQNKIVAISNSSLGKEFIEVAPRDNLNARLIFFSTLYSAAPARTIQLIREVARHCENVSSKIRPIVRIRNLGDSGIEWEIKVWLEDYSKYNDTDALIRQRLWYAFQREGIHFAFPTRTLYIENQSLEPDFAESVDEVFERLSGVPLFTPLTDEETRLIAEKVEAKIFTTGEKIVRRGQEAHSMYVIQRGSVKVQINDDGELKLLRTLAEGEFFGEMGLFTGEPRTATVITLEETEVLEITHDSLKPVLEANPELVARFAAIIEERRAKIAEIADVHKTDPQALEKGMFDSIRKFFGLKS